MRHALLLLLLVTACKDSKPGAPPIAGETDGTTTSDLTESSSSTGLDYPDDCRVLLLCQAQCMDDVCRAACEQAAETTDVEYCYEWLCDARKDACDAGDPAACALIPMDCVGDGTSSTGSSTGGTSSGGSTSGGSSSDGSSSGGSSSGGSSSGETAVDGTSSGTSGDVATSSGSSG